MRTALIVSPEPETRQLATLAFELDGWKILSPLEDPAASADIALFDIPDREQIAEMTETGAVARYEGQSLVILPRGVDPEAARRSIGGECRFIRRPFEIMSVVRLARELAEEPAPKKKAVPRRALSPSTPPARKNSGSSLRANDERSEKSKGRASTAAPARKAAQVKTPAKKRPRKKS